MTEQPKSERIPPDGARALSDLARLEGQINDALSGQSKSEQPNYVGAYPWMAQWWLDHLDVPPLVIVRCGKLDGGRQCRNAVGEIKTDGEHVMAMSRDEHPETEAEWTQLAAPTASELAAELAERDAQVLRYVGDGPGAGRIVYKRTKVSGGAVAPVSLMSCYVCRVHGPLDVNPQHLAEFASGVIADTPTHSRTYWAHREVI
jgi:hypothetical protein